MRKRTEIETDHKTYEEITQEILLDIRELLMKQNKTIRKKRTTKRKEG